MSETSQGPIVGDRNCLACVYEHGTRHGLPMSISSGHVHTCTPLRDDPTEQPNIIFGNPRPFNAPIPSPNRSQRRRERIEDLRRFIADADEYRAELLALEKIEQDSLPTRNDEEGD